jgi:hypothetical protein
MDKGGGLDLALCIMKTGIKHQGGAILVLLAFVIGQRSGGEDDLGKVCILLWSTNTENYLIICRTMVYLEIIKTSGITDDLTVPLSRGKLLLLANEKVDRKILILGQASPRSGVLLAVSRICFHYEKKV